MHLVQFSRLFIMWKICRNDLANTNHHVASVARTFTPKINSKRKKISVVNKHIHNNT